MSTLSFPELWSDESEQVYGWLLGETAEAAEAVEAVEAVEQAPVPSEDITFEPQVITVSAERRRELLTAAGWHRVSMQFLIRSFDNELLASHVCFLQYTGPRDETNTARASLQGGTASFPDFWLKPDGVLRLLAVPIAGSPAQGGPLLEGSLAVPERIRSGYIAFAATQDHQDIQVRAADQHAVAEQMQVQGNVKFSILGTAEVGGGVTSGTTTTRTATGELTWVVRIGRPGLVITAATR